LADGASVRLRAAGPAGRDDNAFQRLFFTLSDTTRYLYFCAGVPSTALWAERFVALGHADDRRSYVLVAEAEDDVIGFARFDCGPRADPRAPTADLGIVLTDSWQRRGLGGHMLQRLAAEARCRGVATFAAEALWENRRMVRLARRVFPNLDIAYVSGSCVLTIGL
jgi:L-amino acid N-acyltransferase YncA